MGRPFGMKIHDPELSSIEKRCDARYLSVVSNTAYGVPCVHIYRV